MERTKRSTKKPEAFKPDNFNKPKAQKQPKKSKKQPKQNQAQPKQAQPKPAQAKNSINKAPRFPEYYKDLKLMNDATSAAYLNSLKLLDFNQYTDADRKFTIWEKMEMLQDSIDPKINGPNSFINGIYKLDYTSEQYNLIKYKNVPTLDGLINNQYIHIGPIKSDKNLTSFIRFIIKNVPNIPQDLQDLKFIIENHRKILNQLLILRFNKQQSITTVRNDLYNAGRLMRIAFGDDNELKIKLIALAMDFDQIIRQEEGQNKLNKYEQNFIPYGALLDLVEQTDKLFRESLRTKSKDDPLTFKYHMYSLILKAYLWTPPVRLELSDCKFTDTLSNLNNNTDYVYIPNDKSKLCEYVFNKDKKGHKAIRYYVGFMINTKAKISENLSPYAFKLSDFMIGVRALNSIPESIL